MLRKNVKEVVLKEIKRRFSCISPKDLQCHLGIVGVPFGKGQKKEGMFEEGLKIAPDHIRKNGFIEKLESIGVKISNCGDVTYQPCPNVSFENMLNLDHVAPCIKEVSNAVTNVLESSKKCLVLGGDHTLAVGSIYSHMNFFGPDNVAVVYVDAHADLNTATTSISGNLHGMTVSLLAQELKAFWPDSGVPGLDWLTPCLHFQNLAYIGLRSIDHGEAEFLCNFDVPTFTMEDVGKLGIHKVLGEAFTKIDPEACKSIHLSFDIDALDSYEAPCATLPARGGLTLREGIDIAETIHRTGRLSVMDLVEVNLSIGDELQKRYTLDAARHILLAAFGKNRRGNTTKNSIN